MSSQPAPHPSIETAYLDAEAVLFDERTGSVHQLNPSASAVWMLLDGELSPDQLARELSELFGAPGDVVRADVDTALVDFAGRGLLVGSDPPPAAAPAHDHDHHGRGAVQPDVLARPPDP